MLGHLFKGLSRHKNRPNLGNGDFAVPIYHQIVLGINAAPEKYFYLITGTNDVFLRNGHIPPFRYDTDGGGLKEIVTEGFQIEGDILVFAQLTKSVEKRNFLFLNDSGGFFFL